MRKRIIHYAILLAVLIVVNFFLPRLLPGSPIGTLIGDDPGSMPAEEKMGILSAYHLNEPLWKQFLWYLKDLFTLNWGNSYAKRQPILQLIGSSVGWTVLLAMSNLIISSIVGTLLGAVSAMKRKKHHDLPIVLGTAMVSSLPSFWVAIFMIAIFGVRLGWFPIYGAYSMWENYTGLAAVWDIIWHMILPVATMVITSLMMFFTTSRFGVLNAINQDYVRMARMRGIPNRRINLWYIMRNTMVPIFTIVMMDVGYLLSGSVLIETVFSYPGLGTLMYDAVAARDYPLIQYCFLLSSFVTILALFLADILYHKVDPMMEVADA
jgi:peptide/nickel transport system permease protein